MTTKFLDSQIFALSKSYCRGVSHGKKTAFLDDFPLCPRGPPTSKSANFIFIVVSPSLTEPPEPFFRTSPSQNRNSLNRSSGTEPGTGAKPLYSNCAGRQKNAFARRA